MSTLGEAGESAALARIFPRLPAASSQLLGPGDDAAVLATPDGRVVITTDMMVHGPDFRLAWSSAHDLGWKAAASNLADVAAMGARPTALVLALAAPTSTTLEFLEQLADGLRDGCTALAPGCGVIGGDLSVSDRLTIAVTAFGDLEGRSPVLRSGARSGDVVAVSGALGLAAEGLRLLFELGVDASGAPDAAAAARVRESHPVPIAAQLTPSPPIADGVAAALAGASAMLDLSDGLAIDARRIASASAVALDLDPDGSLGLTPLELDGGEDHSLLATFPPEVAVTGLPGGFRPIGVVREPRADGQGLLVRGAPYQRRGGWDPYDGWNGEAG
jgi:thiamine-monophosphate kinase